MIQGWSGESSKAKLYPQGILDKNKICKDKNLYLLPIEGSERSIRLALSKQSKIELDPVWLAVTMELESART